MSWTVKKAFAGYDRNGGGTGGKTKDKGSGKAQGPSAWEREIAAVEAYIGRIKDGSQVVYWLQDFHQVQRGRWRRQSPMYFQKELGSIVAASRGSACEVVIGREAMNSYMENLSRSVSPPSIDTALLAEEDRAKNFISTPVSYWEGPLFTNWVLFRG